MLAEQLQQLIFWLGVILFTPALYRFSYAASGLLWRRLFPVKKLKITLTDQSLNTERTVIIDLSSGDRKTVLQLLDEAVEKAKDKP